MLKNLIVLADGTTISTGAGTQNSIKNVKTTSCVNDSTELSIGSVCASAIEATIFSVGGNLSLTAGAEITLYKVADDGTKTKKGVYVLEKPTRPSANTLKLTGYDNVTKLDKDLTAWVNSLTGWPFPLLEFAGMVCNACGLKMVSASVPNSSFAVYKPAKSNVTGRQLMKWLGEICCRFVRADADGNIEFGWYKSSGVTVTPAGQRYYFQGALSYETYKVAPVEAVQIRLADSDSGALWPEVPGGTNSYIITGNAILMAQVTESLIPYLQNIANVLNGVTYTPCEFSMPACLDVEAGSIVTVTDKNGNTITTYVMTKTTSGQRDTFESTGSYRRDSTTATNNQTPTQEDAVSIKKVEVYYYLSQYSTDLSGGSWSTTAPKWVNGMYMWSKTVTTYSNGTTTESDPVCITGASGSTGSTGETGVGVESITTQFYLSTSKAELKGGAWATTMPTWANGYYLWTRSCILYTDGTIAYTAPVCDSSWEAVNDLDSKLDMGEVLYRLTGGYVNEGLYIENGHLLINGSYIKIGEILADLIKAGVIKSKDGTSVVIDLDDGSVDLTGTFRTTTKIYSGSYQSAQVDYEGFHIKSGASADDLSTAAYYGPNYLTLDAYKGDMTLAGGGGPDKIPSYFSMSGKDIYNDVTIGNILAELGMEIEVDGGEWEYRALMQLNNVQDGTTLTMAARHGRVYVTGLTKPVDSADAVNKAYIDGFGLGQAKVIAVADLDSITAPGWYCASETATIAGSTANYWYFHVSAYGAGDACCIQEAYPVNSYNTKMVRFARARTWDEWEYVNPPMISGVEYRTTERHQGKAVYVRYIDLGNLPESGSKSVAFTDTAATVVSYQAYVVTNTGNTAPFPWINSSGTILATVTATTTKIAVFVQQDLSTHTAYAIVRYVKD